MGKVEESRVKLEEDEKSTEVKEKTPKTRLLEGKHQNVIMF